MIPLSYWHKLKLLLWKNLLINYNMKFQLPFEFLLPVVVPMLLMIFIILNGSQLKTVPAMNYRPENLDLHSTIKLKNILGTDPIIPYYPQNRVLDGFIKHTRRNLKNFIFKGFRNISDFEIALNSTYFMAIQFDEELNDDIPYVPKKVNIRLRFPAMLRYPSEFRNTWNTKNLFDKYFYINKDAHQNRETYLKEGYLHIQHALALGFMTTKRFKGNPPEVTVQRFPYNTYRQNPLEWHCNLFTPISILCGFLYPYVCLVRNITRERESPLKEVMQIMGLPNCLHWLAWFLRSFVLLSISCIFLVYILKSVLINNGSTSLLYTFILVYAINGICVVFFMSVLFNKSSTAASYTILLWFLTYLPKVYLAMVPKYAGLKILTPLYLLLNTSMAYGIEAFLSLELYGEGLQWEHIFTCYHYSHHTLGYLLVMMCLSSIICLLACLMVEQMRPIEYGTRMQWNSIFDKNYWWPRKKYTLDGKRKYESGFQAVELTKEFLGKSAVTNFSMDLELNEITALLGHNGAGKSILVGMIVGMITPTAGTAIINGYNIQSHSREARMSLGICPKENVLFAELTVKQHLIFFGYNKGLKGIRLDNEIKKYLALTQLEHKKNVKTKQLSLCMQRKLCLASALIGHTKVLIYDEASYGLDPAARRELWNLLRAAKSDRAILLVTHFMEEADALANRIAIMCDGELKCHQTAYELKKAYSSGYRLICLTLDNCDTVKVTQLLQKYITDLEPYDYIASELTYQLSEIHVKHFEIMFRDLEANCERLNLSGFGIGISTLEEAFLKVGAKHEFGLAAPVHRFEAAFANSKKNRTNLLHRDFFATRKFDGNNIFQHLQAMLMKKILYTKRNKAIFLLQTGTSIMFALIIFLHWKLSEEQASSVMPPMKMGLWQYNDYVPMCILEVDPKLAKNSVTALIAKKYQEIVEQHNADFKLLKNKSFSDFILKDMGRTMQPIINYRFVAAVTVSHGKITVWLNRQPLHAASLSLSLVDNAMVKTVLNEDVNELSFINHPLPTSMIYNDNSQANVLFAGIASQTIPVMLSMICSLYIIFLIKERANKAKLLQIISGCSYWTFWLSHYIWDIVTFSFSIFIFMLVVALNDVVGMRSSEDLVPLFSFYILCILSLLPLTYLLSNLFKEPAIGFLFSMIFYIISGTGLFLFVTNVAIENAVLWYFRLSPMFCFANGHYKLLNNTFGRDMCRSDESTMGLSAEERCKRLAKCCDFTPFMSWDAPGIGPEVLYLCLVGLCCFLFIIFREYYSIEIDKVYIRSKCLKSNSQSNDETVENEKIRVFEMSERDIKKHNLVLVELTKYFQQFLAVNKLTVAIKPSECFGLLGINGAGKTTIYKMLTGDEGITHGKVFVKGMPLLSEKKTKFYREIGYCPQSDALIAHMTGWEHLKMYCLLRGISNEEMEKIATELPKTIGLLQILHQKTDQYSDANKRKLITALAFVGSPCVVCLDEPTASMDPASRRHIWNIFCQFTRAGKSLVLTTNSLDECEVLCKRMAIMVNGEFKCLGSVQHIKNKYSKGYMLMVRLGPAEYIPKDFQEVVRVKNFITELFPDAVLQDEYQRILTFYVPSVKFKWSEVFGVMERRYAETSILDYTIFQTRLEDVFLDIANPEM